MHGEILALYQAMHADLVRLAVLVAPEDGYAEDLVQETFVRVYKSWRRVRRASNVEAYLRRTLVNLAHARGRRIAVARRTRPDPMVDERSAEDGVVRRSDCETVIAALKVLSARQRECLVLRHYEHLTEREIAETLGISVGSVRTHIARGTKALQQTLGGAR